MGLKPPLVLLLVLLTLPVGHAIFTSETEAFEDDTPFLPPDSEWYTVDITSGADLTVTSSLNASGTHSATYTDNGIPNSYAALTTSLDACAGGELHFWMTINNYVGGSIIPYVGISQDIDDVATSAEGLFVSITSIGVAQIHAVDSTGVTTKTVGPVTNGTFSDFHFVDIDCNLSTANWYSNTLGAGGSIDGAGSWTNLSHFLFTNSAAGSYNRLVYVDDIEISGGTADIASSQSISVSNLVGFDVDPSGTTAIARLDAGNNVSSYSAGTLASSPTVIETNCNRFHGVAALRDYVSLLHCVAGDAGDVDQLQIRTSSLATPSFDACTGGSFCTANLNDEDLAGPQDDQLEITGMDAYPFDYSVASDAGNAVYAAWGFSTLDGRAGVMTYVWRNNFPDNTNVALVTVDPSGGVTDQVCTTIDNDGTSYLYTASDNSNVRGYRVDFDQQSGSVINAPTLDVSLAQVFPGTASTSGPIGVACGEGRFAALTPTTVSVWDRGSNSPVFPAITGLAGTSSGGVALSDDGEWLAYLDTDGVHVLVADNGTEVALLTPPAGTFRGLELHGAGSYAWVATSDNIARYDIYQSTTGQDTAYDPTPVPPPPTTTTTTSTVGGVLLGESINRASQESGLSTTAIGALVGLVGILVAASLAAVGLGLVLGLWGGVVGFFAGATAGTITSHYLGVLEPWVVAFLVFMALLMIVVLVTVAMRRG